MLKLDKANELYVTAVKKEEEAMSASEKVMAFEKANKDLIWYVDKIMRTAVEDAIDHGETYAVIDLSDNSAVLRHFKFKSKVNFNNTDFLRLLVARYIMEGYIIVGDCVTISQIKVFESLAEPRTSPYSYTYKVRFALKGWQEPKTKSEIALIASTLNLEDICINAEETVG